MKQITIGQVKLPLRDFAVAATALLGIRKAGKTYTAKGIAEQLLDHKIPIVVFDPIGVWRFLKVPAPHGRGFKIVVAGGAEPDLPLTPEGAKEIIRAAIRENISVVIDLYDKRLSKKDWRRIVEECFRTLMYENKGVRMVILEEAAEYIPQKLSPDLGSVYAEVEKVARMGGNVGLGLMLINQRSQEVNKAVLELCDNLVLMRQRGNKAIESLEKWMDRLDPDTAKKIAKHMPSMTAGECYVWTEDSSVPVHTHGNQILSFHPDRRDLTTKNLRRIKSINTTDFVTRMSASLPALMEEQKENDPKLLRARIKELEKQVQKPNPVATEKRVKVNVPVLAHGNEVHQILKASEYIRNGVAQFQRLSNRLDTLIKKVTNEDQPATPTRPIMVRKPVVNQPPVATPQFFATKASDQPASDVKLGEGHMRILRSLFWLSNEERTDKKIAFFANYTVNGHFNNLMTDLRKVGLVQGREITEAGKKLLPEAIEPKPTGPELREWFRPKLNKLENEMLDVLIRANGNRVEQGRLCEDVGKTLNGHTNNTITHLRTIGVAEGGARDGGIKVSDEFL